MDKDQSVYGLDRRAFLRRMAGIGGAALAAGVFPTAARAAFISGAGPFADEIGVQLYTVRDKISKDFEGVLAQVAELGYKKVEFAGYYNHTPEQVRQLLDRLGLKSPSVHVDISLLQKDLEGQARTAAVIGHEFLTIPALPGGFGGPPITTEKWHAYAQEFNTYGKALSEKGLRLAYHNHAFEFVPDAEGKTGYDILLAETDPKLVSFELDLMWAVLAGQDPLKLFAANPGRFTMWHVKDMREIEQARASAAKGGPDSFRGIMERIAAVGTGEIQFKPIFEQAKQSGMVHFFVENDAPKESLADIKTSISNLKSML